MEQEMDKPLSQSNVSLKLSEIQKRCQELMDDGLGDLRLVEADSARASDDHSYNPYDHD